MSNELNDLTDRELLVKLATDQCWIKKILEGHLKEHLLIKLAVVGAGLTAITSLVVAIILR